MFHDEHHRLFTKNYASVFSCIDDVFGTAAGEPVDVEKRRREWEERAAK